MATCIFAPVQKSVSTGCPTSPFVFRVPGFRSIWICGRSHQIGSSVPRMMFLGSPNRLFRFPPVPPNGVVLCQNSFSGFLGSSVSVKGALGFLDPLSFLYRVRGQMDFPKQLCLFLRFPAKLVTICHVSQDVLVNPPNKGT